MGLNVSQPGRFKDPRSGDYFHVTNDGKIEFYEISKSTLIDIKMPIDSQFAPGLVALAQALAARAGMAESGAAELGQAIDELCSLVGSSDGAENENLNVLLVGEKERVQVGLVGYGSALAIDSQSPALTVIRQLVDEVKTQALPTKGC